MTLRLINPFRASACAYWWVFTRILRQQILRKPLRWFLLDIPSNGKRIGFHLKVINNPFLLNFVLFGNISIVLILLLFSLLIVKLDDYPSLVRTIHLLNFKLNAFVRLDTLVRGVRIFNFSTAKALSCVLSFLNLLLFVICSRYFHHIFKFCIYKILVNLRNLCIVLTS
jgi:hypothetical protein